MWKNQYDLEINKNKIIDKSCDLMAIIFFTLSIRWDKIAAKNSPFYNHIPVFNCKITI